MSAKAKKQVNKSNERVLILSDVNVPFCRCKVPDLYYDQEKDKEMCFKCKKLSAI